MKQNIASKCICHTLGKSLQGVFLFLILQSELLRSRFPGRTFLLSLFLLEQSQRPKSSFTVRCSLPIFHNRTHFLLSQAISAIGTPSTLALGSFTDIFLGERDSNIPFTILSQHLATVQESDSLEQSNHLILTQFTNPSADLITKLWIPSLCRPPLPRRLIQTLRRTSQRRKTLSVVDIPLECSLALYHRLKKTLVLTLLLNGFDTSKAVHVTPSEIRVSAMLVHM